MLLTAFLELPLKAEGSIMIGDKHIDVEAAEKAGIKGYLFDQKNLYDFIIREKLL